MMNSSEYLYQNLIDANRGIRLTMASRSTILFFTFFLKYQDLAGAVALEDCGFDPGVGQGRADRNISGIFHHENAAKLNLGTRVPVDLFDPDCLTRRYPILLAA